MMYERSIPAAAKYAVNCKFNTNGMVTPISGKRKWYDNREIASPVTNCVAVSIADHRLVCIFLLLK